MRLPVLSICLLAFAFGFGKAMAQQPAPSPAVGAAAASSPLDAWLTGPTLWQTTPTQFPAAREMGFRWVSAAHDAARASSPGLRLGDLLVAEVIARFSPGNAAAGGQTLLSGVQVSIYNRGDAGDLDKKTSTPSSNTPRPRSTRSPAPRRSNAASTTPAPSRAGASSGHAARAASCSNGATRPKTACRASRTARNSCGCGSRRSANRARVTSINCAPPRPSRRARRIPRPSAPPTCPRAWSSDPDGGERLPNIPMVDQGEKGYCVTAATERVLRYYGVDVDQNELAQVANTTAAMGTSTEAMTRRAQEIGEPVQGADFHRVQPHLRRFPATDQRLQPRGAQRPEAPPARTSSTRAARCWITT